MKNQKQIEDYFQSKEYAEWLKNAKKTIQPMPYGYWAWDNVNFYWKFIHES